MRAACLVSVLCVMCVPRRAVPPQVSIDAFTDIVAKYDELEAAVQREYCPVDRYEVWMHRCCETAAAHCVCIATRRPLSPDEMKPPALRQEVCERLRESEERCARLHASAEAASTDRDEVPLQSSS